MTDLHEGAKVALSVEGEFWADFPTISISKGGLQFPLTAAVNAEFNAMHPRGKDGKFITKGHVGEWVHEILTMGGSSVDFGDLLTYEKKDFIHEVNSFDAPTWHNFTEDQQQTLSQAVQDAIDQNIPGSSAALAHIDDLNDTEIEALSPGDMVFEPSTTLPPAPPPPPQLTKEDYQKQWDKGLITLAEFKQLTGEVPTSQSKVVEQKIYDAYDLGKIDAADQQDLLTVLDNEGPEIAQHQLDVYIGEPAKTTSSKATPIQITHALVHAKHTPGTVIAQTSDGKVQVKWNGHEYEVSFKHGGPTDHVKKSKLYAYLAENFPNEKWSEPGKVDVQVTAPSVAEVKPPTPEVPHPVAPKTESNVIDMTGWKQVGGQTGSNKGGLFEAPNGDRYYVKSAKSAAHAKNEVLAAQLYRMAGIDVPEVRPGQNHPSGWTHVIASKIVPNAQTDPKKLKSDVVFKAKVQQGFATDAWLANWDTVGLEYDNIVDSDGKPWRIDVGGSLYFRAQGQAKGDAFGNTPVELDTLRDPTKNPQAAAVFGGMSNGQIRESAKMLLPVTDDKIRQAVKDQGLPDSLADKLIARRDYILDSYNLTKPDVKPFEMPTKKETVADKVAQLTPESWLAMGPNEQKALVNEIYGNTEGIAPEPLIEKLNNLTDAAEVSLGLAPQVSLETSMGIPSELIINNWPGVAGKNYETGELVAFSTDGTYQLIKSPFEGGFTLRRRALDGSWKAIDHISSAKLGPATKKYAFEWAIPSKAMQGMDPGKLDVEKVFTPTVNPAGISVTSILNTKAPPGEIIAIGMSPHFDAQYAIIADDNGVPVFHYKVPGGTTWTKPAKQQGILEKTNVLEIAWVKPVGKQNINTPPSPTAPETVKPPKTAADLTISQKYTFYNLFKTNKVSPSWSGAKIYASLQDAKLKMASDADIANMSDEELLKILDKQHQVQKYGNPTDAYTAKVTEWLKTPNGKKAALAAKSGSVPFSSPVKSATALKTAVPAGKVSLGTAGTVHIAASDKESLYTLFKQQTVGKYLKDSPADIMHSAQSIANAYKGKATFGDLTPMQVLQIIDEQNAKKFGSGAASPPQFSFVHKVEHWLDTPSGQKTGHEIQTGTYVIGTTTKTGAKKTAKKVAKKVSYGGYGGYSTSYDLPADTPYHEKVPAPTGVPKYDAGKSSSDFQVISTSQASSLWNEMQAQGGGTVPSGQQAALKKYTTNSGYVAMNGYLRGVQGASTQTAKQVRDAQLGMRPATRDVLLHRGNGWFAGWNSVADAKANVGKTMHQQAFFSTSVGGQEAFSGKSIQFVIEAPKGTPMAYVDNFSAYKGEREMLLAAGLRYRVISAKETGKSYGTQVIVRLRVIGEED